MGAGSTERIRLTALLLVLDAGHRNSARPRRRLRDRRMMSKRSINCFTVEKVDLEVLSHDYTACFLDIEMDKGLELCFSDYAAVPILAAIS